MQVFNDTDGTPWEIQLDYDTIRRITAETGLDLSCSMPGPLQVQQCQSPVQLLQSSLMVRLNVLWAICRPRAESKGIKRAWWENRMIYPADKDPASFSDPPPIKVALDKLNQELADFFLRNGDRQGATFVEDMAVPWSQQSSNSASSSPASAESTRDGSP